MNGKYCFCDCCAKPLGWRPLSKIGTRGTFCKEHARFANAKDPYKAYLLWFEKNDKRTDAEKQQAKKAADRALEKFTRKRERLNKSLDAMNEGGDA